VTFVSGGPISPSFCDYRTERRSGGTMYLCPYCTFTYFRGRGNDEGAHDRAVATIQQHVEMDHAEQTA
jgi:hypothetical protein